MARHIHATTRSDEVQGSRQVPINRFQQIEYLVSSMVGYTLLALALVAVFLLIF